VDAPAHTGGHQPGSENMRDTFAALPERCLREPEVNQIAPYSSVHRRRLEKDEKFPKRIHLGPGRVVWRLSEIMAWLEEKQQAASK
jgi:prophage regulatory protein